MCGACGAMPSDWATPLVSGPRRRTAVAEFVTSVCAGLTVRTVPQGWTLRAATGAVTVARTLDQLADAAAGRLSPTSWADLEAAVARHPAEDDPYDDSRPPAVDDPYDDYRPPAVDDAAAAAHLTAAAVPVLTGAGALHVRLAAFTLGARRLADQPVVLDAPDRAAPFRLLAAHGRVLGAVPVAART